MRGLGTIVNVAAIVLGGCIGIFLKGGLKKRYQETMMQALGAATIFIGVSGALKGMFTINGGTIETGGTMMMIFTMALGALVGEWLNVERALERFGEWIKKRVKGKDDPRFVEGFVTTSLVVCIGAMAIVGSLQDGLTGDASMLYSKAFLDAIAVAIFASTLGKGAIFSAIPVGLLQGAITLFARALEPFLTEQIISNLSFIGSVLIFCVGVNLAFGKKFRVANMLPALIFVVIYSFF